MYNSFISQENKAKKKYQKSKEKMSLIDWYPGVAVVGLYQTLHEKYGSLK